MSAEARAMLDALMGAERDVRLEERTGRTKQFSDEDVCKYALCGICPYDIFKGTKSDLGGCSFPRCGDEAVRRECLAQWDGLSQEEKDEHGYEYDLMVLLDDLVDGLERKIKTMRQRMDADERANEMLYGKNEDHEEERKVMLTKIEELNAEAEAAGDEGDVEKAMALMEQTKALKEQADAKTAEIEKNQRREGAEKKLRVCDVCGVKIELNPINNEERVQAHYSGKQYKGWLAIRNRLKELKALNGGAGPKRGKGARSARPAPDDRQGSPRDRDRDRDYDRGRSYGGRGGGGYRRDDYRGGGGGKHRDYRDRDRERDRDRYRDRTRIDRSTDPRSRALRISESPSSVSFTSLDTRGC